ncbi:DUF3261 domain-containing protein [Idiomarina xiamenensis]|nr:DUF3261 domain-containing protein [Idiomarina xiamenensis]
MQRRCLLLLLALLLVGCQSLPGGDSAQAYGSSGYLQLQPGWPQPPLQLWQQAQIRWQDQQQTKQQQFMISALLTAERVTLVGLSPLGQELWRIRYDAQGLSVSSDIQAMSPQLARQIVADMQLALWPETTLQERLQGDLRLTVEPDGRQLWQQQQLLLDIAMPSAQQITIENYQHGYRLALTLLDRQQLEPGVLD